MASFFTSKEELKNIFNVPHIDEQEGVYFAYATDPEALRKVVPPQLNIAAPVVIGYIVNIEKPNFGERYMEFALGVPAVHGETVGLYAFSLLLEGPGAFDGTTLGREFDGIPKKYADEISFKKEGNTVVGKVVRKGVTLIDLKLELGAYDDPSVGAFFAPEGATYPSNSFFITYNTIQTEAGHCEFSDGKINNLIMETKNNEWKPASLEIKVSSSNDDPFAELPVLAPLGGAYMKHDEVIMQAFKTIEEVDALEIAQYQFASRHDQSHLIK
ncbi:acetoacetate decarboxylase family protein [Eubacteriaceae bacterium ES3]|nr:acetoacetate decarboxylase family protein [Eubacteriaceae bacterium ES3]